jgi:hypothetical protein
MPESEQIQQMIDYFSVLTKQEFVERFGEEKGNPFHSLYERQFKIHFFNYKDLMPDDLAKRHGINSIFLMAVDDVLMEVRAPYSELKETALSIYRRMLESYFNDEADKLKQSAEPWSAFVEWARKGNGTNYENEYFGVDEVAADDSQFGFDIQSCFYFHILSQAGRPELGPILCEYDYLLASAVKDWIGFQRHETIASGDARCTFRYLRK